MYTGPPGNILKDSGYENEKQLPYGFFAIAF